MSEDIDWSVTTHERNRQRQQEEFAALSFREKLMRLEEMAEVAEHFARRREERSQVGESSESGSDGKRG